jgi:predicted nucleic acid-binding protein
VGFDRIEELDEALPPGFFRRASLPWEAGFLAGKCFLRYRRGGGAHSSPLPDFYIGAHAAVTGMSLLTRDAARYRSYFPTLNVVSPDRP